MGLLYWCPLWDPQMASFWFKISRRIVQNYVSIDLKRTDQRNAETLHENYLVWPWNNHCTQCWTWCFTFTCSAEKRSLLDAWMKPHELKCPLFAWGYWDNEQQGQRIVRNGGLHCKKWSIYNQIFDQKYTYLWCIIFCSACKRNRFGF